MCTTSLILKPVAFRVSSSLRRNSSKQQRPSSSRSAVMSPPYSSPTPFRTELTTRYATSPTGLSTPSSVASSRSEPPVVARPGSRFGESRNAVALAVDGAANLSPPRCFCCSSFDRNRRVPTLMRLSLKPATATPPSRPLWTGRRSVAIAAGALLGAASTPMAFGAVKAKGTATPTTAVTTTLKPRSGGQPIKGWESLKADEWPEPGRAVVARAIDKELEIFRTPGEMAGRLKFVANRVVEGPVVLLTIGERDGWVRVLVPIRPNATVGWVRASEVSLTTVDYRLIVELSSNTLIVEKAGQTVLKEPVAIGTGGTPTPDGLFFVKEIVPQANPKGALGPVALGLSGYSEALFSFAGGSGVIGMHGTNSPGLLGKDVSHGCIRMQNQTVLFLSKNLPLGTPVEIVNKLADRPASKARPVDSSTPAGTEGAAVAVGAQPPVVTVVTTPAAIANTSPSTTTSTTITALPA